MNTYSITHFDLDGVVSNIISQNAMEKYCEKFITISTNYDNADIQIANIIELAKYGGEPWVAIITDLCFSAKLLEKLLKEQECKKVIYIDHHPRDGKGSLEDLKQDYPDHFVYSHSLDKCAALLAYEFFMKDPLCELEKNSDIVELVRLTDIYDCWRVDNPYFFRSAFPLNDLFWKYEFDKFKDLFYNGYVLTKELRQTIDEIETERSQYLNNIKKNFSRVFPIGNGDSLFFVYNPEGKFINDMTLMFPEHQLYLIYRYTARGANNFSVRSRSSRYNVTELLSQVEKLIPGSIGGGHAEAGGISVPEELDIGEFFENLASSADLMGHKTTD